MKQLKKVITILLVLFLFSSCSTDFFDKENPTQLGEGTFYKTEKQVDQAVIGIYGQLQGIISNQWLFTEFITDNTTLHFNEGDRGWAPSIESLEYWQMNSNTANVYDLYRDTYSVIGNINTTLLKLSETEEIDAATKSKFEGELKFFRAYYYFLLTEYFGDAIILTEPVSNPSNAFQFARSPISEVYALIESDLDFAVSSLPNTVPLAQAGRVTMGTALTLQGKVWLTRKDFAKAKASLDQVVALGTYSLVPNYADIFDPNNKNNAESIFEVQFQGGNDLGESSGFIYNFYPRDTQGEVTGFPGVSGGGWNIPTNDIINDYEAGDLRKDVSLSEGYTSVDGDFVPVPFIEKFHHTHSIQGRQDDNWPVFRYADVLLMLAEAINEQSGPTAAAYAYVNQIRNRAGLADISGMAQDQFRVALLHERRIELAFENHRWFDLKRTLSTAELVNLLNAHGLAERANPTTPRGSVDFALGDYIFTANELLLPIPEREIIVNPNLVQNPGY